MIETHENFKWQESGLITNPRYPFMGASPDGIMLCDCCSTVLVEIKCPYCYRDSNIDEIIDCLELKNGEFTLKTSHAYFYQIQCQLLLSNVEYCDFLVWTQTDFSVKEFHLMKFLC